MDILLVSRSLQCTLLSFPVFCLLNFLDTLLLYVPVSSQRTMSGRTCVNMWPGPTGCSRSMQGMSLQTHNMMKNFIVDRDVTAEEWIELFSGVGSFREEARNFRSKVWLKLLFQRTVTWNLLSPALRSYTVTTLMWWTRVLFSSSEVNASVYKLYFSGSSVTSFLQSETDCRHRHGAHLPILQGKVVVLQGCQQVPHW